MSIAEQYEILESQIANRTELPNAPYEPLESQIEEEFRLAQKQRKRYHGLSKKEKNHG